MRVIFDIPTTTTDDKCFLTWAPVRAELRLVETAFNSGTLAVTLSNAGLSGGGQVNFHTEKSDEGTVEITIDLPNDGNTVAVWIAGEFGHPSKDYGDAVILASDPGGQELGRRDCMVRVRKSAVELDSGERDRFLEALATLNDAGNGPFREFRAMHVSESDPEAHGAAGFLPWHRAYILDLERSLQDIDPTVTMPYWRFDEPAPSMFADDFLGLPDPDPANGDEVLFPPGHPLEFWRTDTLDPIERRPLWIDINDPPPQQIADSLGRPVDWVISQNATLDLGGVSHEFAAFRTMERSPHGPAHVSFAGPISSIDTAAKDPLFFMLHTNVDRLWAFWQWFHRRTNPISENAYSVVGSSRPPDNLGHKLDDTMWPWNQETTSPRPSFPPPRPVFPVSPFSQRPSAMPKIREMIDFQGVHDATDLGFSYDDVPFELETGTGV